MVAEPPAEAPAPVGPEADASPPGSGGVWRGPSAPSRLEPDRLPPGLFLRLLRREARGGATRLGFFTLCLGIGVAAVVSIAGLASSLEQGIRSEARQLLAADLEIAGRRPIPPEVDDLLSRQPGTARIDVKEMVTVVAAGPTAATPDQAAELTAPDSSLAPAPKAGGPARSQLVELKVIGPVTVFGDPPAAVDTSATNSTDPTAQAQPLAYPFYGTLELEPPRLLSELLDATSTVVAPDLLSRLGLTVGDQLLVGGEAFRIAGTVLREPDRISDAFSSGPRVFLSAAGLARTGLETTGSRIRHQALVRLPANAPASWLGELAAQLTAALPDDERFRVETYAEAQPNLRTGLDRVDRFLGLVALLSLLVGGVGVAQTVRAWLAGRLDAIAVLRCLGLRPNQVLRLYVAQVAVLALVGSLLGATAGLALQLIVPLLLGDLVPARAIQVWQPLALIKGLLLGVGVAVLFSLPPLFAARDVPPARVLRRSAEPLAGNRRLNLALAATLAIGLTVLASIQAKSPLLGLLFTAGLGLAILILSAVAKQLVNGVARLARRQRRPRRQPAQLSAKNPPIFAPAIHHGARSLGHPASGNVAAAVALGLGVLVVSALALVEWHLESELAADLPADAPSAFMVDIRTAQWPEVESLLVREGATGIDSVPVVMARLAAIDGKLVDELKQDAERGSDRRWALTREQRLTYLASLPADNQLVESLEPGASLEQPWQDPTRAEVSIERDFATELGLTVGSQLRLDIQGVPVELLVSSVRSVDWRTFKINFFLVVEPGVLEEAPQMRIAAAQLPLGGEQRLQDELAYNHPNVTLLQIRDVLDRLRRVLERLGLGVRVLGSFTVLAGVAILAGGVAAAASRRGREVALLKTLGMTRSGVAAALATEQALVGLVAGTVGTAGGALLAYGVITRGMELPWRTAPGILVASVIGAMVIATGAGLLASSRALAQRPIEVLRADSE